MRYYLLAALLAAGLVGGCGSSTTLAPGATDTAPLADTGFGSRIDIPPAPVGAGIESYTNSTYGFSIQVPSDQYVVFDPPKYANVSSRVFELVNRTLPAGDIFRPNVGMIVDARLQGGPISIQDYVSGAAAVLSGVFQNFQVVAERGFALDGHQAFTQENTATWIAPDGTAVNFQRITLYTENQGIILIFTFTAPPDVFEANRATFNTILNSITFTTSGMNFGIGR